MAYFGIYVVLDTNAGPSRKRPDHKQAVAKDSAGQPLGTINMEQDDVVAFFVSGNVGGVEGVPDITLRFFDKATNDPASPFEKLEYRAPMDDDQELQEGLKVVNNGDFEWSIEVDGPYNDFYLDPEMVVGGGSGTGQ